MLTPNLSKPLRALYVVFGIALGVSPLIVNVGGWMQIALPVLGLASFVEGLAGW